MIRYAINVDGKTVFQTTGTEAFNLYGIQYPANWFEHATPGELSQLGFTVEELPDPPPSWVYSSSAERALFDAGLLDQVRTMVANHPYEPVRIYFNKAQKWERNNEYVQALGVELGLSDEQIDSLFIAAKAYD